MCNSQFIFNYVNAALSEIDVIVLAALIRDLDRETGNKLTRGCHSMHLSFSGY